MDEGARKIAAKSSSILLVKYHPQIWGITPDIVLNSESFQDSLSCLRGEREIEISLYLHQ